MKKQVLYISLAFASMMSYAQQGSVGVNTVDPKATVDITKNSANNTNDVEGLLIPRVSKDKAFKMSGNTAIKESTLVYVNDTSDYTTSPVDATVADVTENGYYFWNGAKWVKVSGQGGNENIWKHLPANEGVFLKDDDAFLVEKITKHQHSMVDKDLVSYQIYDWQDIYGPQITYDLAGIKKNTLNFNIYDLSKVEMINSTDLTLHGSSTQFVLGNDNTNLSEVKMSEDKLIIAADNTKDYTKLRGRYSSISNMGSGNVNSQVGGASISTAYPVSNVKINYGFIGQASQYSEQPSVAVIGLEGYASQRSSGDISSLVGVNGLVDYKAPVAATGTVETMASFKASARLPQTSYAGTIKNLFGLYVAQDQAISTVSGVENHHGIHINSIKGAQNNYAIYTNLGKVRFGDLPLSTVATDKVVVADADGVLKTKDAASLVAASAQWKDGTNTDGDNLIYANQAKTAGNDVVITDEGQLGIGTDTVGDNMSIGVKTADTGLEFIDNDGIYLTSKGTSLLNAGLKSIGAINISSDTNQNFSSANGRFEGIKFSTSELERMRITESGNVGIGTDTPTEKLEVAGTVKATSFISATSTFPDYVFEKYYNGVSNLKSDYDFKSLNEVETFVKENGHLPGYISAKEVLKAGQVDMTATQLTNVEKIEELYLHTIEQEKKLKTQETTIQNQQKQIDELKKMVNQLLNK